MENVTSSIIPLRNSFEIFVEPIFKGISLDQGGRGLEVGLAAPQVLFPHARGRGDDDAQCTYQSESPSADR